MRTHRYLLLAFLIIVLGIAVGCEKSTGIPGNDPAASAPMATAPGDQNLPFNGAPKGSEGITPTQTLVPAQKLPAGTPITIRLQNTLSSASSHAGDRFEGTLDEPIVIDEQTVVPRGATITGSVLAAKASGRLHDPGYLRITLVSMNVNGKPVEVATSSIFSKAASHKKRNLATIGGGTAAGALLGGVVGGGKGTLIGTALGAGVGTGAAYGTGKKEVAFEVEHRLTFRLAQEVELR